jgi:hypothetical protein
MYATAALSDGAALQTGVDDHRHVVKLPGRRFWTCAPEFSGRRRMHGSMQNVAPVINQAHPGGMLRLAFLSAVVSLVVSFAAAAAPIPLYNIYRAEDGFTNAGISMAVVAYAVGTIAALLVLGRLSNHLGRRLTARLQPRQFPAHAGDAGADQGLVADDLEGQSDQDRREGGEPRPLHHLPDGRGRHRTANVPRDFAAHRGATAAATTRASMKRLIVTRSSAIDRRNASRCQ